MFVGRDAYNKVQCRVISALCCLNAKFADKEPGHGDKRPWWADLSTDGVSDHPGDSHSGGISGDLLYFTNGDSNCTQCQRREYPTVPLWDGTKPTGMMNGARTARYLLQLHAVFPGCVVRIRDFAFDEIERGSGSKVAQSLREFVCVDSIWSHQHHLHMHIDFLRKSDQILFP